MICYKDKTFCSFYGTCIEGKDCGRALTSEVVEGAKRTHLDISQFIEKPGCYSEAK